MIGFWFIKEDGQLYSLNIMDIATHLSIINPSRRKNDDNTAKDLFKTWKKLEMPDFFQMDIELSFRESNRYLYFLALLLRLCIS